MILVDTSVWIHHFRSGDSLLAKLLEKNEIRCHPWVIGELALGHLKDRAAVVGFLSNLPLAVVATEANVLHLIEQRSLAGAGIGYVDAQLLASTHLTPGTVLWTRDASLRRIAQSLTVAFAG